MQELRKREISQKEGTDRHMAYSVNVVTEVAVKVNVTLWAFFTFYLAWLWQDFWDISIQLS